MTNPSVVDSPADVDNVREILAKLSKGGQSKYCFKIYRRVPNTQRWDIWQVGVPTDSVDDLREFCLRAEEGAEGYDYKVVVVDEDGSNVKSKGKPLRHMLIPALKKMLHAAPGAPAKTADPAIQQMQEVIAQRRQEMAVRAQQLALEREERRLARLEKEQDDDDGDGEYVWPAPGFAPFGGYGGMFPGMFPMQQQQHQQQDGIAAAAIKALGEVAAAKSAPREDSGSMKMLEVLLPIILANTKGLEPKDMMGMMSPLFETMAKSQSDANKFVLENASEGNRILMEKMIDAMKIGGEPEEEIEKYRKYMNLATEGLGKVAQVVFNRQSLLPGATVNVPRLPGPAGKKPALPARAPTATPGASPAPGATAEASPQGGPTPPAASPADAAKQVIAQRVRAFLESHEQEMLVESDPAYVADQLDDLWMALPASLRERVLISNAAGIYESMAAIDKEIVERIMKSVEEDKTGARAKWCEAFWERIKEEPEEEEEEEEEGEGDDPDPGRPVLPGSTPMPAPRE